jgi:hypothetical protein
MKYNPAIDRLTMPTRFLRLPISENGFPVPKFVAWPDGKPDFRAVDAHWLARAMKEKLCWLCGEKLGQHMAFVIGPMCAINRINSEPPSHLECARFAVKACPFLTQPKRGRNRYDLPEDHVQAAGIPLDRNPGVTLIWVTKSYRPFRAPSGVLFSLGDPTKLEWYCRGQTATRDEILQSINSGLPLLRKLAEQDGPDAIVEFNNQVERGMALVPT